MSSHVVFKSFLDKCLNVNKMVAKLKSSFLKNSFHLFCYKTQSTNSTITNNNNNNNNNNNKPLLEPESAASTKRKSRSKTKKKPQDLIILSDTEESSKQIEPSDSNRSKSSNPDFKPTAETKQSESFKSKILKNNLKKSNQIDPNPFSYAQEQTSLYSSDLKLNQNLKSKLMSQNPKSEINLNSILLNNNENGTQSSKKKFLNCKKVVRFADSLGLELESVISVNNDLNSLNQNYQIRRVRFRNQYQNPYFSLNLNSTKTKSNQNFSNQNMNMNNYFSLNQNYVEFLNNNLIGLHQSINQTGVVDLAGADCGNGCNKFEDEYEKIMDNEKCEFNNKIKFINLDENENFSNSNNQRILNTRSNNTNNINLNQSNLTIKTRINNGKLESEV